MPDWEKLVTERLGHLKLAPEERREVIAEIAAHLEECYQALCAAGSPDPEGYTMAQVRDWKTLRRKIRRAKEDRMSFARKILMPVLATLAGFYFPWLFTLPLAGALGAWLVRRGTLSPALAAFGIGILFGVVGLLVDSQSVRWGLLFWLTVPPVTCAIGALPFLSRTADA